MHSLIQVAFDAKSTSSASWAIEALRLKRAAEILFAAYSAAGDRMLRDSSSAVEESSDLQMIVPASLLYGLALENLLKARIIEQKRPRPGELGGLFGGGSGHSLVHLASDSGLTLSDEERDLANRLTYFVEWAGRYPVPKKVEKMVTRQSGAAIVEKRTNSKTGEATEVRHPYVPLPLQQHEQGVFESLFERAAHGLL